MSEPSPAHTDVLFIIGDDIITQMSSGALSLEEGRAQLAAINMEINRRITETIERQGRQIKELQANVTDQRRSLVESIKRYEDFLETKGLSDEFEEYEHRLFEKGWMLGDECQ